MGAELVLSLVGVVFLKHGTLFLDELPVVFHPATVAIVSAVGLAELGLVCGGGRDTVDSLLFRDVDRRALFDFLAIVPSRAVTAARPSMSRRIPGS